MSGRALEPLARKLNSGFTGNPLKHVRLGAQCYIYVLKITMDVVQRMVCKAARVESKRTVRKLM